jgi:hypothetical protein
MNTLQEAQGQAKLLPLGVKEFLLNADYWDPQTRLCPHDSWVECIEVREFREEPEFSTQRRSVHLKIVTLGAYHDAKLTFSYSGVSAYALKMDHLSQLGNRAHGDWIEDRFEIADAETIRHLIKLSSAATIDVSFKDVTLTVDQI